MDRAAVPEAVSVPDAELERLSTASSQA